MSHRHCQGPPRSSCPDASPPANPAREPVTLMKGVHRWTFACDAGHESALLKRLSQLATDDSVPFDWFDAALVSHQLSKRLRPGLQRTEAQPLPESPEGLDNPEL